MAVGQINLLITLSAFSLFIHNPVLFRSVGFSNDVAVRQQPVVIGFFLYQLIMNPLDPLISLVMNSITRRYEYEAGTFGISLLGEDMWRTDSYHNFYTDRFACGLDPKYKALLSSSLIKLMNENLSSPHQDWLYSTYHHSHPSLLQRLEAMEKLQPSDKSVLKEKADRKEL
jgi:STE24 endopeptidase